MLSTWQAWIYEPREILVQTVANATWVSLPEGNKRWNRGYIEGLIRPRIATLVLSLVAHFGTEKVSEESVENCRSSMPYFCAIIFNTKGQGVIQAYCNIISGYVCSLLEGIEPHPVRDNRLPPLWLPKSLQDWVNDAKDVTQKTLRLMPMITLVTSGHNMTNIKSVTLSDLLVAILENPDPSCPVQTSLEEHCSGRCKVAEEERQMKKQKKEKKAEEKQQQQQPIVEKVDTPNEPDSEDECGGTAEETPTLKENMGNVDYGNRGEESAAWGNEITPATNEAKDNGKTTLKDLCERRRPQKGQPLMALHADNRQSIWNDFAHNKAILPRKLVEVLSNSVQHMAKRHYVLEADLATFNSDVEGHAARKRINDEMIGEIYTVITKYAERHARDFPAVVNGTNWTTVTGGGNFLVRTEDDVSAPDSMESVGRKILDNNEEQKKGLDKGPPKKQEQVSKQTSKPLGDKENGVRKKKKGGEATLGTPNTPKVRNGSLSGKQNRAPLATPDVQTGLRQRSSSNNKNGRQRPVSTLGQQLMQGKSENNSPLRQKELFVSEKKRTFHQIMETGNQVVKSLQKIT